MAAPLADLAVMSTRISSACRMVLSRWATTRLVRPAMSSAIARWIWASASASTELVASSSTRMRGIERQRPGEAQQLTLADAQAPAPLAQLVMVARRQPLDEAVGAHPPRGLRAPPRAGWGRRASGCAGCRR